MSNSMTSHQHLQNEPQIQNGHQPDNNLDLNSLAHYIANEMLQKHLSS